MTVYTNEQPNVKADIAERLKSFRKKIEQEASTPIWEVEASVVFVLDDLCGALGLSETQRAQVLGPGGVAFAREGKHHPSLVNRNDERADDARPFD